MSNQSSDKRSSQSKFLPWSIDAAWEHKLFLWISIAYAIMGFLYVLFLAIGYALVHPGFWFVIVMVLFGTLSINSNPVGPIFFIFLIPLVILACLSGLFCYYPIAIFWNTLLSIKKSVGELFRGRKS
jgi:hypothetical protein